MAAAGHSVDKLSPKAPMSTWAAVLINPFRTHALSRVRTKAGCPLDKTGLSFMTQAGGATWWPMWGAQAWPWHPDPGPYLLPIMSPPVPTGLFPHLPLLPGDMSPPCHSAASPSRSVRFTAVSTRRVLCDERIPLPYTQGPTLRLKGKQRSIRRTFKLLGDLALTQLLIEFMSVFF